MLVAVLVVLGVQMANGSLRSSERAAQSVQSKSASELIDKASSVRDDASEGSSLSQASRVREEKIDIVMASADCSRPDAIRALKLHGLDTAEALAFLLVGPGAVDKDSVRKDVKGTHVLFILSI